MPGLEPFCHLYAMAGPSAAASSSASPGPHCPSRRPGQGDPSVAGTARTELIYNTGGPFLQPIADDSLGGEAVPGFPGRRAPSTGVVPPDTLGPAAARQHHPASPRPCRRTITTTRLRPGSTGTVLGWRLPALGAASTTRPAGSHRRRSRSRSRRPIGTHPDPRLPAHPRSRPKHPDACAYPPARHRIGPKAQRVARSRMSRGRAMNMHLRERTQAASEP